MSPKELREEQDKLLKMRRALIRSLWADVRYRDGQSSTRTRRIAVHASKMREQLISAT